MSTCLSCDPVSLEVQNGLLELLAYYGVGNTHKTRREKGGVTVSEAVEMVEEVIGNEEVEGEGEMKQVEFEVEETNGVCTCVCVCACMCVRVCMCVCACMHVLGAQTCM